MKNTSTHISLRTLLVALAVLICTLAFASIAYGLDTSTNSGDLSKNPCIGEDLMDYSCQYPGTSSTTKKPCGKGMKCGPDMTGSCVKKDAAVKCEVGAAPQDKVDALEKALKELATKMCEQYPTSPECGGISTLPKKPSQTPDTGATEQSQQEAIDALKKYGCSLVPDAPECQSGTQKNLEKPLDRGVEMPPARPEVSTSPVPMPKPYPGSTGVNDPQEIKGNLSSLCESGDSASCRRLSSMSALSYIKPAVSSLAQGNYGPSVKKVQQFLNAYGYPVSSSGAGSAGNETKYYGSFTRAAVMNFQRANGLVADGVVGPKTLEAMNNIIFINL